MEGYDFTLEVPEIDGALLMELLEESNAERTEDVRLGCVIQSLEAEIGSNEPINPNNEDCEECGHGDILSDLYNQDLSGSSAYVAVEDPLFDWVEMEVGSKSPDDNDMGGWYMDEAAAGMVGYGDQRDYGSFYYGELSMEQVYIPLWQ